MANLFLAYIDRRLEDVKNTIDIDWLGFFQFDFKSKLAVLKSNVGAPPPFEQFPLGAGQIGKAAQSGKNELFKATELPLQKEAFFSVIPVMFAGESVGILCGKSSSKDRLAAPEVTANLSSLASQIAALWVQPAREHAIVVDEQMGKLKNDHAHYDWVGVYKLVKDKLYLVSFRGSPSPHEIIPRAKGICGAAVEENRTLNIADVKSDERYLSCDAKTRSEIVVPIRNDAGVPIGEIDIDSHTPAAFKNSDAKELEELALELAPLVVNLI